MSDQPKKTNTLLLILREFSFVLVIQTIALFIFYNISVIEIFGNSNYTINILTTLYVVLAYKALTFSYSDLTMRSSINMLYSEVANYIYADSIRKKIIAEMYYAQTEALSEKEETKE